MIDRVIIDTLNLKSGDFTAKWINKIRKSTHLLHYNQLDDNTLQEKGEQFYPLLARTLDRGYDRSAVGSFFVKVGKENMRKGIPVSEVIYAIGLFQKVIFEYMMTDFAHENPIRMYQSLNAFTNISDLIIKGSFYITKGYLEDTYTSMNTSDQVSEELLKKYFKDDFFFKQDY